jgi:creatinine amidohydrolase
MLPLDTDIHIADRLALDGAREAAERHGVRVLVLPTLPFGLATHHSAFAGTITFTPQTYVSAIADVLRSVVSHGFRKIAVLSGHGGNMPALELGIRQVVWEQAERQALRIALFRGHEDPEFARRSRELMQGEASEGQPGIHASRWETSETLADRPDLVRTDRLEKPTLKRSAVPEWCWRTEELTGTGAFGDPSLARADLGEKMWAAWAESVGLFIKRLSDEPL